MFSRRTSWSREESALAQAERAARRDPRFIDLTLSNPTKAGVRALGVEPILGVSMPYEPAPLGLAAARGEIAAYYARRGVEVDPDRVVVVSSTAMKRASDR